MKKIFYLVLLLFLSSPYFFLSSAGTPGPAAPFKLSFSPQEPVEGTVVVLEIKGFQGHDLKWDFGDGTIERGGTKYEHIYQRTGMFTVKVFDSRNTELIAEEKIRVVRDAREIILQSTEFLKDTPVKVEARGFMDKTIKWDFGDGSSGRWDGWSVTHTYTRAGNFKITVVDLNGKDTKQFSKPIRIIEDNRTLDIPAKITAGEAVTLAVKNTPAGNFTWEFSNGKRLTGSTLKDLVFQSPGMVSVTVTDNLGKLPPITGKLNILPDNRELKVQTDFALPDETVNFDAVNFMGRTVMWDFGDGTVLQNAKANIAHKFTKNGKFTVKVKDDNGKSLKEFARQITIADLSPTFQLNIVELAFDNGKYYKVTGKNQVPPRYHVKFKARGRGILKGKWLLDGKTIGLFETILEENRTAVLDRANVIKLPVMEEGMHYFTLDFTNYKPLLEVPVIRYFVTDTGEIEIISPVPGEKVPAGASVRLEWRLKEWKHLKPFNRGDEADFIYEVAVSEIPFQFLKDDQVQWKEAGNKTTYTLDISSFKNWVYWQVRRKNPSGKVVTTSDIGAFNPRRGSQAGD